MEKRNEMKELIWKNLQGGEILPFKGVGCNYSLLPMSIDKGNGDGYSYDIRVKNMGIEPEYYELIYILRFWDRESKVIYFLQWVLHLKDRFQNLGGDDDTFDYFPSELETIEEFAKQDEDLKPLYEKFWEEFLTTERLDSTNGWESGQEYLDNLS